MPRNSFDITQKSAISVARWRVEQIAKDPKTPMFKRMALNAALTGGHLDEIFAEVYGMGFTISADANNPLHQQMLAHGSILRM